ncbi:MAG: hypothetical protein CSB13_08595 [Chloroflexi bacterium]|nr:MAG: hypothetical protein CSB13_08595 [Chloroflexota bacterium]
MKPLVYYCRWQGARLKLRGRDETAVFGQLAFNDEAGSERLQAFHYNLKTRQLTLKNEAGAEIIQLDEMGVIEKTL